MPGNLEEIIESVERFYRRITHSILFQFFLTYLELIVCVVICYVVIAVSWGIITTILGYVVKYGCMYIFSGMDFLTFDYAVTPYDNASSDGSKLHYSMEVNKENISGVNNQTGHEEELDYVNPTIAIVSILLVTIMYLIMLDDDEINEVIVPVLLVDHHRNPNGRARGF